MSAFVVSQDHINAIVRQIDKQDCPFYSRMISLIETTDLIAVRQSIGQLLWDENFFSVNYRYKSISDITPTFKCDLDSPYLEAIQVLKLINCLDYQSCEHETWRASLAKKVLDSIKDSVIRKLSGYEDAKWAI